MKRGIGPLSTYVALLRGINLASKNRLAMKDLAEMFVSSGCADVKTYIQSGNVVFRASTGCAGKVPGAVGTQIKERFGFDIPLVLRTSDELRDAVRSNPFREDEAFEKRAHVMFLADLPDPAAVQSLDPDRSPPDRFVVRGRDIYLYIASSFASTKLTNSYFDRKLGTVSTVRNWRTVLTLLEMIQASG